MARDGSAWLKRPAPRSEARIKLYCLPHGGGSARAYAAWGDLLPDWIEVVALELPGHGRRRAEPAIDDMGRLVAALVAEIGADIDRPYAIFGHSVGALVAFETARALVASGADAPLRVFLAGYAASSRAAAQPMSGLCDGDLIDALAALGGLGGQAGDGLDAVRADRELAALVLAAVRADFRLAEAHAIEPAARLAVPLTVLGGADDESVCSADLHGWSAHAAAGFQACVLPGGHFFTETSRAALLDILADRLAADVAMLPPSIARGPAEAYPVETCLHALFREAARTFGEATALVGVDRSLSFTALDAESDRLAHHLVRLGCGVDRLVGLFLETSVDYVVAYLAALKAGGAYMPIPLGTPDAAIADILAAAAPVAVVTRSGLSQRLPPDWSEAGRVLELASHGRGGELQATPAPATLDPASQTGPGTGPATGPGPDSLAYCVMTSGTTGAPKGILCPHRGAVNSYWWRYRHLPYGPGEREAANIFFVWEVLRPLLVGVPAYVIPDDTIFDPRRLIAYLERHAITRVLFTPSLFEQVLASAGPDIAQRLAALDIVILNGEVVPASLVATARRLLPHVCIVNDYSISETHDVTTATRADWAKPCLGRTLPVGRVMANVAVYILGEDGRPVPWGCQGEVHVGGASVARGYLGRPEEAAERFLPDPFEERPGASMFRTGDRGRLRQDGQLEVTGRIKFLVKIRGYSVVPAAIEAEIASVDGIAAALVVAVEDEATGRPDYLVAYVAGADGAPGGDAVDRLKTHLARRLPAPAIPRAIVPLDRLPLDARTGKVDRRALPRPAAPPSIAAAARAAQAGARDGALRAAIAAAWQDVLGAPPPASDANFFEHGGHSLKAIELTRALSVNAGVDIAVIDVFNAPTVKALADLVAARGGGRDGSVARNASRQRLSRRDGPLDVAVIGMALRLPGAASPQDLWSLIVEGRSAIRTLTDDELRARGVPDALLSRADYVKAGAHVADVDLFDHAAFGLSAAEATLMDPQQRLFLMCCREALERAGRAGGDHWRTGVWAGAYLPTYLVHHLGARRHLDGADPTLFHLAECGNDKDYIAARAAFHFGCQGPAISVQTSCSTGLVAIAEAARAVADGRCDMALAGAASLTFPQGGFVALDGHVGAASGACRAFDARADGTILGDGVGVVLLKRLSDAMADGDSIHAVIKGAGIGNDGSGKAGFSAPSATGQAAVIAAAIEEAGFAAASIGYVEAHGTGTRLGDPIELAGLADGFARSGGAAAGSVALGSIKPNIGHANIAAGVAGFLKAVLVVREGVVPPLVNLAEENPLLRLSETPFRLPRTAEPWGAPLPRRAGVSSFGIGGTNAHIVIEAPPSRLAQRRDAGAPDGPFVLPLSARTPDQARNLAVSMAQAFDDGVTASIGDIAGTLQHGRAGGAARIAVVAGTQDEAARALRARAGAAITARSGGVAFVVPGHGADPSGSGSVLAALSRGAAGRIAELSGQFERLGVNGVADVLMAAGTRVEADVEATQAALFTASVVLAEVLAEVGVSPVAIAGHSLGEYAAAVMVGALDVEDAIALVAARGRGIAAAEPGAMLALAAGPETAEALLADVEGLSLAVINGPLDVVVAGREEAIARAERWAQTCGIAARRLAVARAFHSPAMRGAAELLEAAAATHATRQPSRPLASNLTGRFLDGPTLADGPSCYWARQMLAPVRFAEVVAAVAGLRPALFIEVGCGRMLARAVRSIAGPDVVVLSPLAIPNSRVGDGRGALLAAVAAAFEAGADIDWARLDEGRPFCRVELPTTPFERVRLWPHDDVAHAQEAGDRPPRDAAASERGAAKALFYTPSFARLPEIAGAGSRSILPAAGVVVAGGSQGLRRSVIGALLGQGADVIDIEDDHPARVAAALSARRAGRDWPRLVWVDDWLGENADNDFTEDGTARPLTRLIALLQAVASVVGSDPIEVWAVTTRGLSVAGEASDPRAAMLAAPVLVASQEVLNLAVRLVDVEDLDTHADALAREVLAVTPRPDRVIGLRGRHAWAERFEPMEPGVGARERGRRRLVESGPHLLIGGNGRIGGAIARHCAAIGAEVVACARSTPPDGVPWRAVRCDVTDEARLYQVLDEAAGGGRLGVVFHAAGLADLKYLEATTPASIAAELDAKVAGTQALSRALDRLYRTRSVRPEAVVLFGSLAGLIGGYGMAAYGAANRYLDAIAEGACNGPVQWIAIDWDDWNFDYGREQTPVWERRARAFALGRQEGVAALETILGEPRLSRVAVAGSDLERRRRAWCVRGAGDQGQFAARSISAGAAPPSIHTHAPPIPDTVADEGELLRHVLEAYAEVLGGDGLAADSDFFDLGGDSLTAARLALALKRRLAEGSDVRLALVLEHATPGALASALAAAT